MIIKKYNSYRNHVLLILICAINIKSTVNSADCNNDYIWHCDSNNECINSDELCDGLTNCQDGSDETAKNCIQKVTGCQKWAFMCSYGACIAKRLTCDGKMDCADGSDELEALCHKESWEEKLKGTCSDIEMQCLPDNECISSEKSCDGVSDCKNGFDEAIEVCSTQWCHKNSFRCGYGACVNGAAACNGISECRDNSDESIVMCGNQTSFATEIPIITTTRTPKPSIPWPANNYCILPKRPNIIITKGFTNEKVALESKVPENTYLNFACEPGYAREGYERSVCLSNSQWSNEIPTCFLLCSDKHPTSGFSTTVTFEYRNSITFGIKNHFQPNTIAKVTCANDAFKQPYPFSTTLRCQEQGYWFPQKLPCKMVCGKTNLPIQQFSKGGTPTNITEVPWHVGIHRKSGANFENICGGSIISPRIVISAAHCFRENADTKIDLSSFVVVAGKLYKELSSDESNTQIRNITNVWTSEEYKGKSEGYYRDIAIVTLEEYFIFSDSIRPVCLRLVEEAERTIQDGKAGKISAWGQLTIRGGESTLQTLQMSTVSYAKCNEKLPTLQLRGDKFCLEPFGDAHACKGDSGSGFVIQVDGIFYLYGIISYSPSTTQECSRDNLLVMTNVLTYRTKLEEHYDNDIKNDVDYAKT